MSTSRDFLSPAETQQIRAAAAEEIHNTPPSTPAQRALAETVMAPALLQSLAARTAAAQENTRPRLRRATKAGPVEEALATFTAKDN